MSGDINDAAMQNRLGVYVLDENNFAQITNTSRLGLGTGNPGPVAVPYDTHSSEQVCFPLTTADVFHWKVPLIGLPYFDSDGDIRARAIVGSSGGALDTGLSLGLHIKGLASGEEPTNANSSADGNITWPDITLLGADKVQETDPMNLGVAGLFADDLFLLFACTCISDGDATGDEPQLWAIILEYQMRLSSLTGYQERTV